MAIVNIIQLRLTDSSIYAKITLSELRFGELKCVICFLRKQGAGAVRRTAPVFLFSGDTIIITIYSK